MKTGIKKRKGGLAGLVIGLAMKMGVLGISGCGGCETHAAITTIPVDQVLIDHSRYRLMRTESSGLVRETTVRDYSIPDRSIKAIKKIDPEGKRTGYITAVGSDVIIKDLPANERGYATLVTLDSSFGGEYTVAEIHLPKEPKVEPGTDKSKHQAYGPVQEVK